MTAGPGQGAVRIKWRPTLLIREAVRRMPMAEALWRQSRRLLAGSVALLARVFVVLPLASSRLVRAAFFDAAKPNTLLLSNISSECYLVSSNDKVIGREVFVDGAFDFGKFEKIFALLDARFEKELLIDVGANIGTICIPAIKRGMFSRAIAFEPEPFNYALLSSNIGINGLSGRITSHNVALGAAEGESLAFELSETNYGDHRVSISRADGRDKEGQRKVIHVKSESLDAVIGSVDPRKTLIWMDTQGFEGFVLKGAEQMLRSRPPMVIEFWPYGLSRTGSYELLKQSLCQSGYSRFYELDVDCSPRSISEESFDRLFARLGRDGAFTDLLII